MKESNRRSPSLQLLSDAAERLWYRLITAVDDFGRMEADPQVVFTTCFQRVPRGWTVLKVREALLELSSKFPLDDQPLVKFYEVRSRPYLQIVTAETHIRCRAEQSKYPDPPSGAYQPVSANTLIRGSRCQPPADAGKCRSSPNSDLRLPNSELRTPELSGFDRFWKWYPKKKSKGQAEMAWKSLKPNEQLQACILAALEQAKTSAQWTREAGRYIPHPATWLRAKGWEDEQVHGALPANVPEKPPKNDPIGRGLWDRTYGHLVKAHG